MYKGWLFPSQSAHGHLDLVITLAEAPAVADRPVHHEAQAVVFGLIDDPAPIDVRRARSCWRAFEPIA
jgi:hypothetical protein